MEIKIILGVVIILFSIHKSAALFKNRFMSNMKEKAKQYYQSKFGKKGLNFLGYDLSEYPGTHKIYRKQNKEKWDEYYNCLKMQKASLGFHRSFTPEAIQNIEGNSVRFDCKICLSPVERDISETIEWEFGKIDDDYLTPIEFTEHIFVSPEDKSLTIYNLQEENSGQYVCRIGQTITAPIYLTVIKSDLNLTQVHPPDAPHGPYPTAPAILTTEKIIIDTIWTDWSPCSTCGKTGKKHKYGHCIVLYNKIQKRSTNIESGKNDTKDTTTTKIDISKDELDLIKIFRDGVPCQSYILPESFKNQPEVKMRELEIMIGYCKTPCPKPKLFEVKDKAGRVIEVANNSAGVYSMLQPLPHMEPTVKRTVEYRNKGDKIVISCPGNLNSDTPIHWQIGSKNVIPELIRQQSAGRISVTVLDKIQIKDAKVADSNLYRCWQNDALAGAIRLVVEKKIRMNFNHHIMLLGVVIILSTFLYVFIKAFFGRKYARTY